MDLCFSSFCAQSVFGCPAAREFSLSSIKQLKFRENSLFFYLKIDQQNPYKRGQDKGVKFFAKFKCYIGDQ
jgi:hypothetical protein